ncbi:MAG TPA: hypothetical protein VL026_10480 [Rhizomicrobium sp.]|nr:hypothetical protein [Rhizomicrobium sp.]
MTQKPRALISASFALAAFGSIAPSAAATVEPSPELCLRSDELRQITMAGDSAATVKDRNGRLFHVAFTAPCGARHVGVFFTTQPQNMQTCLKPGVPLNTNRSGACVVKSVQAAD